MNAAKRQKSFILKDGYGLTELDLGRDVGVLVLCNDLHDNSYRPPSEGDMAYIPLGERH